MEAPNPAVGPAAPPSAPAAVTVIVVTPAGTTKVWSVPVKDNVTVVAASAR